MTSVGIAETYTGALAVVRIKSFAMDLSRSILTHYNKSVTFASTMNSQHI